MLYRAKKLESVLKVSTGVEGGDEEDEPVEGVGALVGALEDLDETCVGQLEAADLLGQLRVGGLQGGEGDHAQGEEGEIPHRHVDEFEGASLFLRPLWTLRD